MTVPIWVKPALKADMATHHTFLTNAAFKQPDIWPWELVTSGTGAGSVSAYRSTGYPGNPFWGMITINISNGGSGVTDVRFQQDQDFFNYTKRLYGGQTYIWLCYLRCSSATKQVRLRVYSPENGYDYSSLWSSWTVNTWTLKYIIFTPGTTTRNASFQLCVGNNTGKVGFTLPIVREAGNNLSKEIVENCFKDLALYSGFNVYGAVTDPLWWYVNIATGTYYNHDDNTIETRNGQSLSLGYLSLPKKGWRYHNVYATQTTLDAGKVTGDISQYPDEPTLPELPATTGGGNVLPLASVRQMAKQFGFSGPDVTDLRCLDKMGFSAPTSSGTATFASTGSFTVPQDGWYFVSMVGGGGGGCAGDAIGIYRGLGGGGAPLCTYLVLLSNNDIYNVTLGSGGIGGGASGTNGSTTTFLRHSGSGSNRATLYAPGGGGAVYATGPGSGHTLATLVTTMFGYHAGQTGFARATFGYGGDSGGVWGRGGADCGGAGDGYNGSGYGAGGGGGAVSQDGGDGSNGYVRITWIR